MADYFSANPLPVNTLMAVPLHPKRLKERGYNQSDLLASHLANKLDLPVDRQSLVRRRYVSLRPGRLPLSKGVAMCIRLSSAGPFPPTGQSC